MPRRRRAPSVPIDPHGLAPGYQAGRGRGFATERAYRRFGEGPHGGRGPKGYQPSDDRIFEILCDQLMLDPEIDPSDVEVEVGDGEITLSGTVASRWMKFAIEDLADSTLGVREVHNRLRLRRPDEEDERAPGRADTKQRSPDDLH